MECTIGLACCKAGLLVNVEERLGELRLCPDDETVFLIELIFEREGSTDE